MTYTHESGRRVTAERIRRGAERMEAQHFLLRYECPLSDVGGRVMLRSLRALHWEDDPPYPNDIPGQPGRFI